eukprot:gene692-3991_t
MAESRYNIHSQQEHCTEWVTNQHRDTYASMIGHENLLDIVSIVENQSRERTRFDMLKRMISPCGPPDKKLDQDDL